MTLYERNLSVIRNRDEELYRSLENREFKEKERSCFLEAARNGEDILCVDQDGRRVYLNSRYDPGREVEQYVARYKAVRDYAFLCFFGFSNGMIARKLMSVLPEHVTLYFYEPCAELFTLVLENYDLTALLQCERVRVVVRDLNDGHIEMQLATGLDVANYRISRLEALPMYRRLYPDSYDRLKKSYDFHVMSKRSNVATYASFGKILAYNNIYNMRSLFFCNCGQEFEDVFPTDRPAILVSAGPSLEKNARYLKDAKGYFLIIAVDSAMPYLARHDIRPDLMLVVDAEKPVEIFEDELTCQIPWAIASDINYEILERTKQKILYVSSECAYYHNLFQLKGRTMYQLPGGGSVSTYAMTLALSWGYKSVILVGQDLAITPDQVHAGRLDIGAARLDEERLVIDGYYGQPVYTLKDYNYFKQWYESVIRGDSKLRVINATEGGARIEGAEQLSLKEAIEAYRKESFDFETAIREKTPTFSHEDREDIIHMWKNSIRNLEQLEEWLAEGVELAGQGISRLSDGLCDKTGIMRIYEKLSTLISQCDDKDEIIFLDEMVAGEEADLLGDIFITKDTTDEELCRIFGKLKEYMQAMHDSVDEVKAMFVKIIEDTVV